MNRDDGFSLVELLVVIVLLGIIGSVVLTGVVQSLQVSAAATRRVDALTAVQRGQERMSRMIRAADPISAAGDNSITVDVYPAVDERRQITYTLSADGTQLDQTVETFIPADSSTPVSPATTTPLLTDLAQTGTDVFFYRTIDGTEWVPGPDFQTIRRVEITLVRAIDDNTIPLTTSVYVRNNLAAAP